MLDAIRVFVMMPFYYLAMARPNVHADVLGLIPFLGVVALMVGFAMLFWWRDRALWWFAVPVLVSQILAAMAGAFPKSVAVDSIGTVMLVFLGIELVLVVVAGMRARRAWPSALGFAIFCLSYAAFVAFLGGMALSGNWI